MPERILDAVTRAFGAPQRHHLVWWGQRVFAWDPQEHRDLMLWEDVLRFCADSAAHWQRLGLPTNIAETARREFSRANDREPYDERQREVFDKRLSDWDLHMYAINLFDDDDVALPTGPHTYLYPTFKNHQGYRFWSWLLKQLTPREQESLRQHASAVAGVEEGLAHVGQLPRPDRLEIGP